MFLQELPPEILLKILHFLPLSDILTLSGVSCYLMQVCREKFVWRMLTRRDYGALTPHQKPKQIYRNFYHKLGKIVGVYRLFTFFSKHLLHIKVDPEKSGQIVLRTWPLEAVGVDARKGRDVMRICYQRTGQAIGLCLEGNDEDNKVFCFNDHLESEEHCFAFHYCTGNLFFNPLKGDHDFSVKFCPKNKCLAPEFTKVVCCQKILKFKNGNRPEQQHIIQPGIFARYHLNENQNRLLLGPDTFYNLDTIGGAAPVLSISQFTSQHEVLSASLLMPCDLANMSRGCLLNVDTPAFDVDHMVGKPFPWCEAGMRDIRSGGIRDWPKLYRAAYFDVANTAFIVLFDGRTVGCFFSDGTFDLLERFDFI